MGGLELRDLSHRYGSLLAVDGVSLAVAPGEVVCLLGPSGCGKTTLLRVTAGLEALQTGQVLIGGEVVADERLALPPEQRRVGLVFQEYALFPHLTVVDNVAFGLRQLPGGERRARALDVLAWVGMADLAGAYPHTLSGGQQQRVALARALAPRPTVMLLDEPFAGLDRRLREQIREDSLRVLRESGAAVLLVTHDPEEAMAMGDRIAVMRAGRLEQVGTPAEVYLRPASAFAARFLGETNRFEGVVANGSVETPLGPIPAAQHREGQAVEVLLRPEFLRLEPAASDGQADGQRAVVRQVRLIGPHAVIQVSLGRRGEAETKLFALQMGSCALARDEVVRIGLNPGQAFVFPLHSERNGQDVGRLLSPTLAGGPPDKLD